MGAEPGVTMRALVLEAILAGILAAGACRGLVYVAQNYPRYRQGSEVKLSSDVGYLKYNLSGTDDNYQRVSPGSNCIVTKSVFGGARLDCPDPDKPDGRIYGWLEYKSMTGKQ